MRAAEQASRADARAIAEAEKRRKQAYLEARQAEVAAKNTALQASIIELDELLSDTLRRDDHIDLQTLKRRPQHPAFNPGADADPLPAPQQPRYQAEPQWTQFEPVKPTGLAKAFGGRGRYERDVSAATERFEAAHAAWQYEHLQLRQQFKAAVANHHRRDQLRLQRLEQAKASYDQECRDRDREADEHNYAIDTFADSFAAREPDAIIEYFGMVLANSVYPEGFPQQYRVAYVPESAQLVIEYTLPAINAVPREKEYRYVKARDEITVVCSARQGRPQPVLADRRPSGTAHGARDLRGRPDRHDGDGGVQRHRLNHRPIDGQVGHAVSRHAARYP